MPTENIKTPVPCHSYGMVGFIKELVDEQGAGSIALGRKGCISAVKVRKLRHYSRHRFREQAGANSKCFSRIRYPRVKGRARRRFFGIVWMERSTFRRMEVTKRCSQARPVVRRMLIGSMRDPAMNFASTIRITTSFSRRWSLQNQRNSGRGLHYTGVRSTCILEPATVVKL